MTTRWRGIAKYGRESPAHFSKNEQRAEIQSSQEGTDFNWILKRKTHLQEHRWTLCLTPTWNHKEEIVCQVTWILSNTGKVGQRIQKARGQWNLYQDLHLICDPESIMGTSAQKPFPLKIDAGRQRKRKELHDPRFPFRWETNQILCDCTVKQIQFRLKKRGSSSSVLAQAQKKTL